MARTSRSIILCAAAVALLSLLAACAQQWRVSTAQAAAPAERAPWPPVEPAASAPWVASGPAAQTTNLFQCTAAPPAAPAAPPVLPPAAQPCRSPRLAACAPPRPAPCSAACDRCPAAEQALTGVLALTETIRVDHQRWDVLIADWRAKAGGAASPAPQALDVKLWPSVAFSGPPSYVVGSVVVVALLLAGVVGLAAATAIKPIALLQCIWAEAKAESTQWRAELGTAIAKAAKLALWIQALVFVMALLTAVVLLRGTFGAAGAAAPSPVAEPTLPASAAGADAALTWQLQADQWRHEAALARSELAGVRSAGTADGAGAARTWIDVLSLLLGAVCGALGAWLLLARRSAAYGATPSPQASAPALAGAPSPAAATVPGEASDAEQREDDPLLLQQRCALWKAQIEVRWQLLLQVFKASTAQTIASDIVTLQRHARVLQRDLQEIIAFNSAAPPPPPQRKKIVL